MARLDFLFLLPLSVFVLVLLALWDNLQALVAVLGVEGDQRFRVLLLPLLVVAVVVEKVIIDEALNNREQLALVGGGCEFGCERVEERVDAVEIETEVRVLVMLLRRLQSLVRHREEGETV